MLLLETVVTEEQEVLGVLVVVEMVLEEPVELEEIQDFFLVEEQLDQILRLLVMIIYFLIIMSLLIMALQETEVLE